MLSKCKLSITETDPELILEWSDKNTRKPSEFSRGSDFVAIWKCKNGHEWKTKISHRSIDKSKCPYCIGRKVCYENCLAIKKPELLSEWDYGKNTEISPFEITYSSRIKVYWKCNKGHEWEARVYSRSIKGYGCSKCSYKYGNKKGKLFIDNCNDRLLKEWDFHRNIDIDINKIKLASKKKIWWKCIEFGHSWQCTVQKRALVNQNCPFCSNHQTDKSKSLGVLFPELIDEWDINKNTNLTPFDVVPGSNKRIYWICKNGHSWDTTICNRFSENGNISKCPECTLSKNEKIVKGILEKILPNEKLRINRRYKNLTFKKSKYAIQLDFYFPNLNFAIEYQGEIHFFPFFGQETLETVKERDLEKIEICKNNNIHLLHINYWEISDILAIEAKLYNFLLENIPESISRLNIERLNEIRTN